jgi:hypothetical protein
VVCFCTTANETSSSPSGRIVLVFIFIFGKKIVLFICYLDFYATASPVSSLLAVSSLKKTDQEVARLFAEKLLTIIYLI